MPEFKQECRQDIVYFGNSELLGLIANELSCCPDSCFSKNTWAWYNSLYSELSEFTDCRYQVEINEELCPEPDTEDELITLLARFALGDIEGILIDFIADRVITEGRRQGRRTINAIEGQLRRRLRNATSREVD